MGEGTGEATLRGAWAPPQSRFGLWVVLVVLGAVLGFVFAGCKGGGDAREAAADAQASQPKGPDCAGDDWTDCLDDGVRALTTEKDAPRALKLFQEVCDGAPKVSAKSDRHSTKACLFAAKLLARGAAGVAKDAPKAMRLYARSCDDDGLEACVTLGERYATGQAPGGRDAKKAAEAYAKACEAGHDGSCDGAKRMREIVAHGWPDEWAGRCDKGDAQACLQLGRAEDEGTLRAGRDVAKAVKHLRLACDKGVDEACAYAAMLYKKGDVEGGKEAARAVLGTGCDRGGAVSCRELGLDLWYAKKRKQAVAPLQTACDKLDAVACASVAQVYLSGRGAKRDFAKARVALDRGCKGGQAQACKQLKELDAVEAKDAKGKQGAKGRKGKKATR